MCGTDCDLRRRYLENIYNIFLKQDFENDYFDVIFHVQGKELYAHGLTLAEASPVFNEMLIKNRSTRNEPIIIDDYCYNEFFEFLRCIYWPYKYDECFYVTGGKFYVVLELANVYEDEVVKGNLREYLENEDELGPDKNDIDGIFSVIELSQRFSKEDKCFFDFYVDYYFDDFIDTENFLNLDKSVIKVIFDFAHDNMIEKLFEKVYQWGERKAFVDENMPEDERNELVLYEIKDFIPFLKLEKISNRFLNDFVVKKGLLSVEEVNRRKMKYVKIQSNRRSLTGYFVDNYGIYDACTKFNIPVEKFAIPHMYLHFGNRHKASCKDHKFKIPSIPSTVQKMKGCKWYLLFEKDGTLAVKFHTLVNKKDDYLIAELSNIATENDSDSDSETDEGIELIFNSSVGLYVHPKMFVSRKPF